MISRLKLLFLVNWKEDGNWYLLSFLKRHVQHVSVLQPVALKHFAIRYFTYLSNYLSEFYVPFMALISRKRFDVVISWQMRLGICYGILKRIIHRNKPPLHIIQDFHIDLTKTGGLYRMNIALLKLAIPGIDYFYCTSREEEEIYSTMFNIPRNRIVFLPLVESPATFEEPSHPTQDYIFSYGKSDRDFDTLLRAVTSLNIKTFVLSQKYKPRAPVPENVSIMRDHVSDKEMVRWIASSRMVVIPLKDYLVSAGQISMLEVMALARPLVITENMATKEYAVHRKTAMFFEAGKDTKLAEQISYLWNNRELAEQMGQEARQAARKFNEMRSNIFISILENCALDIQKGEHK